MRVRFEGREGVQPLKDHPLLKELPAERWLFPDTSDSGHMPSEYLWPGDGPSFSHSGPHCFPFPPFPDRPWLFSAALLSPLLLYQFTHNPRRACPRLYP